jgi:hypothetical protein
LELADGLVGDGGVTVSFAMVVVVMLVVMMVAVVFVAVVLVMVVVVSCGEKARLTFSIWTEFTVPTGKKVNTREECH